MKRLKYFSLLFCFYVAQSALAAPTVYCHKSGGYLKIGMSANEIKQLCGEPIHIQEKEAYLSDNVPQQQVVYSLNSVSTGTNNLQQDTPTEPVKMIVTIVNRKVTSISIDGNATSAATICPGGIFKEGSQVDVVLNACGKPSYINHSYQKVIHSRKLIKNQVWTIKFNEYGPSHRLTFSDGILQSID